MPNDMHIQIACYAMTGEGQRKSSGRIGAPPEIILDIIRDMTKEHKEAGLPEQHA